MISSSVDIIANVLAFKSAKAHTLKLMISDTTDRYLEASVEDFVTVAIEDFKTSLKKVPCTAMTPALPGTILRNNDGNTILHKEYRSMVAKLPYL